MNVTELALVYGVVGLGWTVGSAVKRRSFEPVNAGLLFLFWPLYGPFFLMADRGGSSPVGARRAESDFSQSLRKARGTPLADLLPDEGTAEALESRLEVAAAKRDEIDALLREPDFDERAAEARWGELRERADGRAASAALSRLQNIRRLRLLRDRFCSELEEVGELLGQLRIQAEVVRIAGSLDEGTRELVSELMHRIEGLDAVLDDTEA